MNLNNTLLRTRLGIGFAVVLGLGLLIAGLGVLRLDATVQQFTQAARNAHEADAAEQWKLMTELNITRAIAVAKSGNHAELDAYFAPQIKATSAQISKLQKELEASLPDERARQLFAEVGKRREVYVSTRANIFKQIKAGNADAQVLDNKLLPLARSYLEALHQFELHHKDLAKKQVEATERAVKRTELLMLALAAVCLAIGSVLAWAITRSVTQPLQAALSATREVAHGELTHPISACGKDEVAGLLSGLEQMRQELGRVVSTVRQMSATVQVSSAEIASGSLELSARTEQAAASLQQSAASMEEIAESVRRTAGAAREAATLADTAATSVDRGNKSMEQMHTTMQSISGRAREMSDIITVIDGIAFQTNILALNAAVEAARAGEQGRGFAVVAGEVRTLAQRSGEAAKQIRKLISTSNEEVQDGVMMAEEAGRAMQGIRTAIADVASVIGEISMMCDQQANAIQEVNTAVTLLDTVTQQNAALVEEASAAATTLSEQADGLVETVAVFKVDEVEERRARRHLELVAA